MRLLKIILLKINKKPNRSTGFFSVFNLKMLQEHLQAFSTLCYQFYAEFLVAGFGVEHS